MVVINWNKASSEERESALKRPVFDANANLKSKIEGIFTSIRKEGDKSLLNLTSLYDGVDLSTPKIDLDSLPDPELSEDEKNAIFQASNNIRTFHEAQIPTPIKVETQKGITCEKIFRPIQNVGLYIPGGTAPLISTLMMLAIPAKVAGCENIILITPPQKAENVIDPTILFAAKFLGFETIYLGGGAQAIAALTYGTETIPKADKIFGPGNIWVTEAKKYASSLDDGPAIDMPAGPSEVLVVADKNARPDVVASDLIAQAEHDPMAQAILVTFSEDLVVKIIENVSKQISTLPRKDIASKSLSQARYIVVKNNIQAIEVINEYAPEHLILNLNKAETLLPKIKNAGSIFMGPYTPESAGDYASGTNHVLPTSGYAKNHSGLGTDAFMKSMTVQTMTKEGLDNLGPTVVKLAQLEGLEGHARAITIREKG